MADNNNNNRQNESHVNWWAKVSLKEWGLVVAGVGFFYLNIVGGVETLKTSVTELKDEIKDLKSVLSQVVISNTQLRAEFNSEFKAMDERIKKIENEKYNNTIR